MVEIRRAGPADVPLIADVLEMASRAHLDRGAWDLMFPDASDRQQALQLLAGGEPSWCHRQVFLVAEQDGEPAAALAGFEPRSIGGTELGPALGAIFQKLGFSPDRMAEVAGPMGTYLSCFPDLPEDVWIVENVGTRAAFRRRGLVAALLDHVLEEGRARGLATAQISCLIGNTPAFHAYERVGFRAVEELKTPEFHALMGEPGFMRMTLAL
ncbi:MAG: GNAT family N-acetyltransferase [Deltaproteobacteria bacterium]|nr:GNAT family N-acetyltransferase [Deltaproteobacteria bacterium]MBW2394479.1 GNAT family N-acetyltransferase [Deltaproteobacteria bacterium]